MSYAIGIRLSPELEKLSLEVAKLIAKEKDGIRRAAALMEFTTLVHTQVIENAILGGK